MSQKDTAAPMRGYLATSTFVAVVILQCVAFAAALGFVALRQATARAGDAPAEIPRSLIMATCSGSVDETPEESPWTIALDRCDKAIDDIDVKSAFLQKWTICGGADSFAISLNPRVVAVTGDHTHCSSVKSEVTAIYLGVAKK
jgi:hypothetical protein